MPCLAGDALLTKTALLRQVHPKDVPSWTNLAQACLRTEITYFSAGKEGGCGGQRKEAFCSIVTMPARQETDL